MNRSAPLSGVLAAVCALSLLTACDEWKSVPLDPNAAALLRSPERHLLTAGVSRDGGEDASIGVILAARIIGRGERVAVLDATAPHVKVYGASGALESAFLPKGGGPGESRHPSAIASVGDSAVLVSDVSGRLAVFRLDGTLRREARVGQSAILALARGCGDEEWFYYGPRLGDVGRVAWLHRLQVDAASGFRTSPVYSDSVRTSMLPVGVSYGLVNGEGRVLARHGFGSRSRLVEWSCAEGRARSSELSGFATVPDQGPDERRGRLNAFVHRDDDATVAGVALTTAGRIMADVHWTGGREGVTEFTLLRGENPPKVAVPGVVQIRDSRPGVGILFSATDPVPIVFLVREADFLALFDGARRD